MIPSSHLALGLFTTLVLGACGDDPSNQPQSDAGQQRVAAAAQPVERSVEKTPAPAPKRIRLFDRMDEARFSNEPGAGGGGTAPTVYAFDFDTKTPDKIWFGRAGQSGLDFGAEVGVVDAAAGRQGGGVRLGPDVAEDRSAAVLIVPAEGRARVTVRGRVRLEGNPRSEDSSSREVLRVVEHSSVIDEPGQETPWNRRGRSPTHRVSRRIDPSGWDRFETSFITDSATRSLEIQLLHRNGETAQAVTRFDDVTVEGAPLSESELYAHLREAYAPRDGNEDSTPWRLRVSLSSADGRRRSESRDAVLLPPPTTLSFPVRMPPAETKPVLRFYYGMPQEAHSAPGDGATLQVRFEPDGGEAIALGEIVVDPKTDRSQRRWQNASLDVTPAAGLEGRLVFASVDLPGEGPDQLDAVVLSTPRIEPAEERPRAFNVLLIGVDTLRADKMSVFGYGRPTTPHLEKLAAEGVRFTNARSPAPWTLPSFTSVLTSLYPSAHGAGRGGHDEWTPVEPTTTSIAEVLSRIGYETQGLVANGLISPSYGADQGFEGYQSAWNMESVERDSESVASFIDGHRTTPWLMFWHIMDPHLPYRTQESYREQFTDADYDGRFSRGAGDVPFGALSLRERRRRYAHEGPPPSPELSDEDRRYVADYYDAEIAEVDAGIGEVLAAIRASGQWDRTIVALVADHGEGLGDHVHYHHGYTLFDDQVHVPMLIRIPGMHEGRVVERTVSTIDLAPTILGALGVEPPEFFAGVDRLAADAPQDDAHFSEYPSYDSSAQKAWILGKFKYLHDPLFHTQALYDLQADPGEKTDIADQHPEIVARARKEMDAFRWRELQKGRFHMRVRGELGQRLVVKVKTDDLFDANFVSRPQRPETDYTMDLDRQNFAVDTVLDAEQIELVFWCRGNDLRFEISLDGEPVGLKLGSSGQAKLTPWEIARGEIRSEQADSVVWPDAAGAVLWLEAGVSQMLPVVLTPEEIERLSELGYTK